MRRLLPSTTLFRSGEIGPERLKAMDEGAATAEIVRLMFGALPPGSAGASTAAARVRAGHGRSVREVSGLDVDDAQAAARGISLSVAAGEILGIAGVDGSGQQQLAEALGGQRRAAAGKILLEGREIQRLDVGARHRLGLRYVTDDRLSEGTVASFPVATNFLLKQIGDAPFWQRGVVRPAAIAAHARRLIGDF